MNRKYILIIVLIVIIAGAVLGYDYWWSQREGRENKIDTKKWLTYRSEEFGYEIKYPKGAGFDIFNGELTVEGIDINLNKYLDVPSDLTQAKIEAIGGGLSLYLSINVEKKIIPTISLSAIGFMKIFRGKNGHRTRNLGKI